MLRNLLYVCFSAVGLLLIAGLGFWWWLMRMPHYYLPPEQRVVQQFETNRTDYIRFVALLRDDQSVRYVGADGKVDFFDGKHGRVVPEYRELIRKIGAKFVVVSEDGSMEFALWGDGCAICSDSYMGARYYPKDHKAGSSVEAQTVVTSLDSAKLPHEKGSVASGLYVVPIEPEWFVYRYEYQE
jgi:hypothetical protein